MLVPLLAAVPLVAAFLPMQARLAPQQLKAKETVAPIDQTWDWKSVSIQQCVACETEILTDIDLAQQRPEVDQLLRWRVRLRSIRCTL